MPTQSTDIIRNLTKTAVSLRVDLIFFTDALQYAQMTQTNVVEKNLGRLRGIVKSAGLQMWYLKV